MKSEKTIWVFLGLDRSFGRKVMDGLLNYRFSRAESVWHFSLMQRLPDPEGSDYTVPDAIVTGVYDLETEHKLLLFNCPVVNISEIFEGTALPTVTVHNEKIGEVVAEHLLSRRVDEACSVHLHMHPYVEKRLNGFSKVMLSHNVPTSAIDFSKKDFQQWLVQNYHEKITRGVKLGIMAQNDGIAVKVIELCQKAGYQVPEQISVVGVDNDDILFRLSIPETSSIDTRADEVGYLAGEVVERLMNGEKLKESHIYVEPSELQARGSSAIIEFKDVMIADAVGFIRSYACEGIDVGDVLRRVPLARRTLEYRFKKEVGTTIYHYIQQLRLEKSCKLLLETDLTVEQIALKCGYKSNVPFQSAFKKAYGVAPGTWRKASDR